MRQRVRCEIAHAEAADIRAYRLKVFVVVLYCFDPNAREPEVKMGVRV